MRLAIDVDGDVAIAQINVNDPGNWDAVSSFGITTYPHVMLFRGFEERRVYRGAFTEQRSVWSFV